jgi:hypothetical protein
VRIEVVLLGDGDKGSWDGDLCVSFCSWTALGNVFCDLSLPVVDRVEDRVAPVRKGERKGLVRLELA